MDIFKSIVESCQSLLDMRRGNKDGLQLKLNNLKKTLLEFNTTRQKTRKPHKLLELSIKNQSLRNITRCILYCPYKQLHGHYSLAEIQLMLTRNTTGETFK